MDMNETAVEKSPKGVHVETIGDGEPVLDDVAAKLEGEIFSGISTQTVLAFLVTISRESAKASLLTYPLAGHMHAAERL